MDARSGYLTPRGCWESEKIDVRSEYFTPRERLGVMYDESPFQSFYIQGLGHRESYTI